MLDTVPRKPKDEVNDLIYEQTKGVVLGGPFAGMNMLREVVWSDGNEGTKLLGTYEEELHGVIEGEIARLATLDNPKIADLGCAEGYYAVGLKRRLPNATLWAVDTSAESLEVLRHAAVANGVEVVVGEDLAVVLNQADLVVCDVEGHEVDYLDLVKFPGLAKSTIVVEVHDFMVEGTHEVLVERFAATHWIEAIRESARDPNRFDFLRSQHSHVRWLAVSEGRPVMMHWLVLRPREVATAARSCGGCNLCCELERVPELDKPSGLMCSHCDVGVGCGIYAERPKSCRDFKCLWLTDSNLGDELRPDKVGLYAAPAGNGSTRVVVSTDKPEAWREGDGARVMDYVTQRGHVLVMVGKQLNFVPSPGRESPKQLRIEWTL